MKLERSLKTAREFTGVWVFPSPGLFSAVIPLQAQAPKMAGGFRTGLDAQNGFHCQE
jgi:hypothetical protein